MAVNIRKDFNRKRPDTSTLVYGKIPPQAPDIEEAILGVLLLEKDKLSEVMGILPISDCFYVDANRKIYQAVLDVYKKGEPVDFFTVQEQLRKADELEIIGGGYKLSLLTEGVISGAHVEAHARIVMEKFIQRELIRVAGDIIGRAYEDSTDVFELYNNAIEELTGVMQVSNTDDWKSTADAAMELTQHMENVKGKDVVGITTGFPTLDRENGGFQGGQLIVLGALSSVGKSAISGNTMAVAAAKAGYSVGVISLEMVTKDVYGRMLSSLTNERYSNINFNRLDEPRLKEVLKGMELMSGMPIFFSDHVKVNILDITNKAYKLKKKHGLDLLIIDYLQLVEELPTDKNNIREVTVAKISRGLKNLAMAMNIPVIALSQLNKDSEKRTDKKPHLSDLRESAALGQNADIVMLLHRDYRAGILFDAAGNSTELEADLIIPKWRNGAPAELKLSFKPETMTFSEPQTEMQFTPPSKPNAGMQNYQTGGQVPADFWEKPNI